MTTWSMNTAERPSAIMASKDQHFRMVYFASISDRYSENQISPLTTFGKRTRELIPTGAFSVINRAIALSSLKFITLSFERSVNSGLKVYIGEDGYKIYPGDCVI